MKSYTVHEPPNPPADRIKRGERLVFVREGFSLMAAIFAPLWMLMRGMWLALLVYIVVVAGLVFGLHTLGVEPQWISYVIIGLHLVLGFELGTLRRWTLERRGWRTLGAVTGRNATECERRFIQAWLGDQRDEEPGEVRLTHPEPSVRTVTPPPPPLIAPPQGSQV